MDRWRDRFVPKHRFCVYVATLAVSFVVSSCTESSPSEKQSGGTAPTAGEESAETHGSERTDGSARSGGASAGDVRSLSDAASERENDAGEGGASNGDPGGGLAAPDDWGTTLQASHTSSSIAVDAAFDAAYADATPLRFADPAETSDNVVEVRALWNEEALFMNYEVADASISVDPEASPWKNDGFEFFVDVSGDGGGSLRSDDFHVILTAQGELRVTRGPASGQVLVDADTGIEHAERQGARGYRLELRIPWSLLEADVASRRTFGLLLGNNDRDPGSPYEVRQFAFEDLSPFAQPDAFGALELTGGPEPEEGEELGEPPAGAIELCNRGLSPGDDIAPVLEQHHASGETLLVCKGRYKLSSSFSISGSNWKIVAPAGATLGVDGTPLIRLGGSNWQFSGFVFEQSGGSNVEVLPSGQNWEFTHIAWKGQHPGGRRLLVPWVTARGTTGVIDHVYMGDGQKPRTKAGAVWVNANANHEGQLFFRHTNIAHFVDNAIYSTGVPTQGHSGLTHVEDSYFHSNTISNARLGGLRGTAHVRNSVFILDGTNPACGVGCSNPGAKTTRAVWAWYGPVEVSNCDFKVTSGSRFATSKGGTFERRNNRFGADADLTPPAGVPMSPDWIFQNPPGYP